MSLIVVSGAPGTGKSTIAAALALVDVDTGLPGAPAAAAAAVAKALGR